MLDIFDTLISAVITGSTVALLTYIIAKRLVKVTKNDIKVTLEEWLNSEKGQKALYQVGGMIAAGAKSGFGLKAGGKMKLEDIIVQLGLGWAQKAGLIPSSQQGQAVEPVTETFKTEY